MKAYRLISFCLALVLCLGLFAGAIADSTVYEGSAAGFGGQDVNVTVTVEDGKVVDLSVDDTTQSYEMAGIRREDSVDKLINGILADGNADQYPLDTVTGATYTTNAIITVVNEALAGGQAVEENVEITFAPGTYTGIGHGRNGEVAVNVTFSDKQILDIEILPNAETPGISDLPQQRIPADIIAYQSLGVDAVTGASLTSNGILTAVADAAEQAGANVSALRRVPVEASVETVEDVTTQIVVVGGGAAGLMAASVAADAGMDVVLLEKLPFLGGSLLVSDGVYGSPTTSEYMRQNGVENDFPITQEYVRMVNASAHHQPDYDFMFYVMEEIADSTDYMALNLGMDGFIFPQGEYPFSGIAFGGERAGAGVVDAFAAHLEEKGVHVMLETSAKEIIMEDGRAVGVKASAAGGDFNVLADKVIIVTGGANYDKELMTSVTPALNTVTVDHQPLIGNTGDGWKMLRAVGAKEGDGPFLKPASSMSFSTVFGYTPSTLPALYGQLIFDANGIRYIREDYGFELGVTSGLTMEALRHGSEANYVLFDTHNIPEDLLTRLQAYTDSKNIAVYGKDIDEIAEKLGIDAKTLRDTYQRYQYLCETGKDVDMGKDASFLVPYNDDGGLYAAFIQPGSYGTVGGFMTDKQSRILNEKDEPIENLFAAGEIATSNLFGDYYISFSLGYYAATARLAAETAVEEINAK